MLRYLAFVAAGAALGYVLTVLSRRERRTERRTGSALALMTLRLVVFVLVVGWLSRAYGPLPGLLALVAAVAIRTCLVRADLRASVGSDASQAP